MSRFAFKASTMLEGRREQRSSVDLISGAAEAIATRVAEVPRVGITGNNAGIDTGVSVEITDATWVGESGGVGLELSPQDSDTDESLFGIIYANSQFVACGSNQTIVTSPDGEDWTTQNTGVALNLGGIAANSTTFVACGASGKIFISDDGEDWTPKSSGVSNFLLEIEHGNGMFVAVGAGGRIITSDDGDGWDTETSGTSEVLYSITYGNGRFVACGTDGTIRTTTDPTGTWSTGTITGGSNATLQTVIYANSTFVIGGGGGEIFISTNGTTWTPKSSGLTSSIEASAYGNGTFILSGSGKYTTSPDGASWSAFTVSSHNTRASAFGNDLFVFVSNAGSMFTSPGLGDLDSVSYTFDPELASSTLVYSDIPDETSAANFIALEKTFLDGQVTAGNLSGVTITTVTDAVISINPTVTGNGNRITRTSTGVTVDLTIVNTGGVGSTLAPTVQVTTQGGDVLTGTLSSYTIVAGSPHSPSSVASTFSASLSQQNALIKVRNHFVNEEIGGYSQPTAIGNNDYFEITSNTPGDEEDLVLSITQGTNGDLEATNSVTTPGSTTFDQIIVTISGGGLTSSVIVGPANEITAAQLRSALDTKVSSDTAVTIANESEGRVMTGTVKVQHPGITFSVNKDYTDNLVRDIRTLLFGN